MQSINTDWSLQPFHKHDDMNPCLELDSTSQFRCPIRQENIDWEGKDVFNPAAVVKDDKVYLLYRAEDSVGKYAGTSRIGIAESTDGLNFTRHHEPVLFPDNDAMTAYEWEGGVEDPRIVEDDNHTYFMTYTAYDGNTARLCVASSKDLYSWEKHRLAFDNYPDLWSKAGAIICRRKEDRLIATRINGKYWMYWGESKVYAATSDDLIHWTPVLQTQHSNDPEGYDNHFLSIFGIRSNRFDSSLVESGPPALITDAGILLIYNGRNDVGYGDSSLADGTYAGGQILFDPNDPTAVIARLTENFIRPDKDYEITGQINNVCFLEGLVHYKDQWFLYYGTADSKIAVATCNADQIRS
jgi:beta-1,2-mannosidase